MILKKFEEVMLIIDGINLEIEKILKNLDETAEKIQNRRHQIYEVKNKINH